jgi:hypothetical protein
MKSHKRESAQDSAVRSSTPQEIEYSPAADEDEIGKQQVVSARNVDVLCGRGKPSFNHGKFFYYTDITLIGCS